MNRKAAEQIVKHVHARTPNYRIREALYDLTGVVVTPEVAAEFKRIARAEGSEVYVLYKHVHVIADIGRVAVHDSPFGWSGASVRNGAEKPTRYGYYSMIKESLERGYHYYDARGFARFPERPRKVSRRLFYAAALEAANAVTGARAVVAPTVFLWEGLPIRFDVMITEPNGVVNVYTNESPFYAESVLRRVEPDARKWRTPALGGVRRVESLEAGEVLRAEERLVERRYTEVAAADGATPITFALQVVLAGEPSPAEALHGFRYKEIGYTTSPIIAACYLRGGWADARRWEKTLY